MLDTYRLDVEEQAGLQHSKDNFHFKLIFSPNKKLFIGQLEIEYRKFILIFYVIAHALQNICINCLELNLSFYKKIYSYNLPTIFQFFILKSITRKIIYIFS